MTFLSLATWQALLLAGLTAAVVTWLFFLKQRHPRVVVGSLLLWERVLDERRAESWLEWLRRLISLLIALTIALLIALALGRPIFDALTGAPRAITIVLDTSPTLATRTADGTTRWEHARLQARHLIDASRPGDRFLVADTSGAVVTPITLDRKTALAAVDRMAPAATAPRFPDLASRDAELVFISDGVAVRNVPSGARLVSVFEPADNVGVTAFEVRPVPADPLTYEAYLEIANYSLRAKTVMLEIGGTDQARLRRSIELGAGETLRQSLELSAFDGGEIRARVQTEGDSLAIDDAAFAYLPSRRRQRVVLVTRGNPYLETLLGLDPRVDGVTTDPGGFREDAEADAYVFDRFTTAAPPGKPVLVFHPPPTPWLGATRGEVEVAGVSSWDDQHPIMRFVPVTDLTIGKAVRLEPTEATPVAMADESPLVTVGERPERYVVVAFDLDDSDFANALGFPIFMQNVLNWFAGEVPALRRQPGTVVVPLAGGRITRSTGEAVASREQLDATVFDAVAPGIFTAGDGSTTVPVAVNVASPDLSNVNRSAFAEATPADAPARVPIRREPWFYMLLAAMLLIAAEWWTYHRRFTV